MDRYVYFDNQTDQILYLRRRDQIELKEEYILIKQSQITAFPLIARDKCLDLWVITDEVGTLIKDPGMICWHDTVTIP
jgi:hypothetical protein